jgi:signal transduction histidine kinase
MVTGGAPSAAPAPHPAPGWHDRVGALHCIAGQIEQLVRSHKTLLANESHELRTPLARIRLALELIKVSAEPKLAAGLERDIAELDWLVDEILLDSRLDAVTETIAHEELDLLCASRARAPPPHCRFG